MFAVYRTLSARYLVKRWFRALLIVASIALGVATLVATQSLNQTMSEASLKAANPLAGMADLIVSNAEAPVEEALARELQTTVPGVKAAFPRLLENVQLAELNGRSALVVGLHWQSELDLQKKGPDDQRLFEVKLYPEVEAVQKLRQQQQLPDLTAMPANVTLKWLWHIIKGGPLMMAGKELESKLSPDRILAVLPPGAKAPIEVACIGTVDAHGPAAALAGNALILDLKDAWKVLGMKAGQVSRIDITLEEGADREAIKEAIAKQLRGRGDVRTPEEQNEMVQNVLSGMQTGFSLCGIAALVVGLFLVYNALAVTVAERRHEIGILLSLGATRGQIQRLFAGEAALMGLLGAALGAPLGIFLATLALQPAQDVMRDIFSALEVDSVVVTPWLIVLAALCGMATAIAAALVPAIAASNECPADAVRRVPPQSTWRHRALQLAVSLLMMCVGTVLILLRQELTGKFFGTYGGMVLVLLGALLITPLLAAVLARGLQPLVRQVTGIEGRIAADNLVRSPARTGLVIAALAAGVSLVMLTAGIIHSNRETLRDWVQESISADLFVTSGSPVGAGGKSRPMEKDLGDKLEKEPGVFRALPLRERKVPFRETQVNIIAIDAAGLHQCEQGQHRKHTELYGRLAREPGVAIASENYLALHRLQVGDTVSLSSPSGEVHLKIIGSVFDFSWNHGTIVVPRPVFVRWWQDEKVDIFDVFLRPGTTPEKVKAVQEAILRAHGAENALIVQTRPELQAHIDGMIERLYAIMYGQQAVVMIVAALGVVTALLISVLQRRREMGLLRAIGASRSQVVRSVLAEALLMGLIGTAIGLVVGVPMEWYILRVVTFEESGYNFPLLVPWAEALIIAGSALALATLAGLGPALYAVRQRIPEAIAYE